MPYVASAAFRHLRKLGEKRRTTPEPRQQLKSTFSRERLVGSNSWWSVSDIFGSIVRFLNALKLISVQLISTFLNVARRDL